MFGIKNRILMDAATEPTGGAGGSTPPPGTPPPGGSTPPPNTDWLSSLPDDIKAEPSLKLIKDIPSLAKSYINAQKMVGSDKISIPGKHATDEDWQGVYQKLGLPKEVKDYDVKFKEGMTIDKDFVEQFKVAAHKSNILPAQAQKLADWFADVNAKSEEKLAGEFVTKQNQRIDALKQEWGHAYDKKAQAARQVVAEIGDPELVKYLNDTGLTGEPQLIKVFAAIHDKFYKESKDVGGGDNNSMTMTPKEAQAEINKVMADKNHPYFVKDHPGHKAAVAEMKDYFTQLSPKK